jgi:hypothetical protein
VISIPYILDRIPFFLIKIPAVKPKVIPGNHPVPQAGPKIPEKKGNPYIGL